MTDQAMTAALHQLTASLASSTARRSRVSLLYLQATRSAAVLSAQAEFQARILPALAEQLMIETTRCGHAQARTSIDGSPMRSRP